LKTQPLPALVRWWRKQGFGVEVVSEFEFLAAIKEGFAPEDILVNGPAKHHWLPRVACERLRVNFDSPAEVEALLPLAKRLKWSCGLRLQTRMEFDPEDPQFPSQFGFDAAEAVSVLKKLKRSGIVLETVHFHLRSHVSAAIIYDQALKEAAEICRVARFEPKHIDCGGGFPAPHVTKSNGNPADRNFSFAEMAKVYQRTLARFPGARQIWVENGRWLTARSGVLVFEVLDAKQRDRMRYLVCDGGRTLNALVSTWEEHAISVLPRRGGSTVPTTVTGPTCMAFDQIGRQALPSSIRAGDHLIWFEAGAYHLPWETSFSHGRAGIYWHDGKSINQVRERENFKSWWASWGQPC
jgi:diaminopimelate decarboxylase